MRDWLSSSTKYKNFDLVIGMWNVVCISLIRKLCLLCRKISVIHKLSKSIMQHSKESILLFTKVLGENQYLYCKAQCIDDKPHSTVQHKMICWHLGWFYRICPNIQKKKTQPWFSSYFPVLLCTTFPFNASKQCRLFLFFSKYFAKRSRHSQCRYRKNILVCVLIKI